MLKNLQALRGVAAGLVLFVHLFTSLGEVMPLAIRIRAFWIGPAGVDIFFVLSGFIVTTAAWRAAQGDGAKTFALRRLIRIYPLYWLVLACCVRLKAETSNGHPTDIQRTSNRRHPTGNLRRPGRRRPVLLHQLHHPKER